MGTQLPSPKQGAEPPPQSDRFTVWVVDSDGLKEAPVKSYSPGGANVPRLEGTLAPPGEYAVCGGDAVLCQITLTTCYPSIQCLNYSHNLVAVEADHLLVP